MIKLFGREIGPSGTEGPNLGLTLKETLAGGLSVVSVERNRIGALAGIKVGDILLNANDIPLRLREDLDDLLAKNSNKKRFFLTVERNQKKLRLPVWFDRQAYLRDSIFKRSFVHQGLDLMPITVQVVKNKQAVGYGVIISPDGWVLTNDTILGQENDSVVLIMQNEERSVYPAMIQGKNGVLDVALLKFNPVNPVAFIEMGDDKSLRLGQWVFSGGNLEGIIQAGMVSATNRTVSADRRVPTLGLFGLLGQPNKSPIRGYQMVIHHDTNIEENQFGTPLVDGNGKLVGINVAHFYRGTTFATPISEIQKVLEDLKNGKTVDVPTEYVPRSAPLDPFSQILKEFFDTMDPKNDPLYELFGKKKGGYIGVEVGLHKRGIEVTRIEHNQPAAKAGLKKGDIIIAVAQQKITKIEELQKVISNTKPGTNVIIRFLRQDNEKKYQEHTVTVCIGQRP
jgi:S1-C subfamily serine protease